MSKKVQREAADIIRRQKKCIESYVDGWMDGHNVPESLRELVWVAAETLCKNYPDVYQGNSLSEMLDFGWRDVKMEVGAKNIIAEIPDEPA